jgi:FkbM family methyltransferase
MDHAISFRKDFNCWWPDYDHAPEACYGKLMRRITDADITTTLCREHRTCIQAGGHVGFWPKRLSKSFERVITFEPDPALYKCLERNNQLIGNITALPLALGSRLNTVKFDRHCSAGSGKISEWGSYEVLMSTIDAWADREVDAIILDVEGYELEALKGAVETIAQCNPVIHVEGLPRKSPQLHAHLVDLGYVLQREIHSDAIYSRP